MLPGMFNPPPAIDVAVRVSAFSATTSGGSFSVPAHRPGDMLLCSNYEGFTTSAPSTLSGWTSIVTANLENPDPFPQLNERGCRLQFIIDSGNSISSVTLTSGGWVAVIRNGQTIGASASRNAQTDDSNWLITGLSSLAPNTDALLIGGTFLDNKDTTTLPFHVWDKQTAAFYYKERHAQSSFANSANISGALPSFSIEIRP